MQVNLENVGAVFGKGQDGAVLELRAVIQLELLRAAGLATHSWRLDKSLEEQAYPLDVLAALSESNHGLVGDESAAGDVKSLEPPAVLRDRADRCIRDMLVAGDVESEQGVTVADEGHESGVGEVLAVGQGQTLDPGAAGEGGQTAVVDLVSKGAGGEVQAPDEVSVREEGRLERQGVADVCVVLPICTRGPVPEQVDGVLRPALADQHAAEEVAGAAELGEDADEDLVGQSGDAGQAHIIVIVVNLHVLDVWDADGGLGVIPVVEVGFLDVGGCGRVGGR